MHCIDCGVGVSGSCWAISTYFTYGERDISKMIRHFKARLKASFTDPAAVFPLLKEGPTNKYLLRGLVERYRQGYTELGIVDIFGTLVASRILIPANEISVRDECLRLSSQRTFVDEGLEPLPIYSAVRHEIPLKAATSKDAKKRHQKEWESGDGMMDLGSSGLDAKEQTIEGERQQALQRHASESWFQWFEITPYYLGCEELEAWIPAYGMGRQYHNGLNVTRTPELKLPIILGYVQLSLVLTVELLVLHSVQRSVTIMLRSVLSCQKPTPSSATWTNS